MQIHDCLANAEICLGKDIEPAEMEDQEHLRGPAPDAVHRRQRRDYFFVRFFVERGKLEPSIAGPGTEVA